MILYHAPSSYYSMIARLALTWAGLDWQGVGLDIHGRKDQLGLAYATLNPHMTVPTLVDGDTRLTDSAEILAHVWPEGWRASPQEPRTEEIRRVVAGHYAISIEQLTFGSLFGRFPPARVLFCHLLRGVIRSLEARAARSPHAAVLLAKAGQNRERLAWFTEAGLAGRTELLRRRVADYLEGLPDPNPFLFGAVPTAADVVVTVLLARLVAIGATDLMVAAGLEGYWRRQRACPAFTTADVWDSVSPWRILRSRPPAPWTA